MSINTLVIGGAGYIGRHLIPILIATGRRVTVLSRGTFPYFEQIPNTVYVAGDFAQTELIGRLLDKHQEVIHLAYASTPNTLLENPLADLQQNLAPSVQLFSQAADRGVQLLLVSSGGTVYGEAINLPICEKHLTKPISSYGVTKLTLESYAYLYAASHGLKFVCVRPSNAFGVGQRPFVGQGFISTAMALAMRRQPISIFGLKGTVRDYIYVSDVASGIVSALQYGRPAETYNLGYGVGLSNIEVIEIMTPLMQEIGCKVTVKHLPERISDVRVNILNSSKLQEHTGWKPKVNFFDGLLRTREWLKSYDN